MNKYEVRVFYYFTLPGSRHNSYYDRPLNKTYDLSFSKRMWSLEFFFKYHVTMSINITNVYFLIINTNDGVCMEKIFLKCKYIPKIIYILLLIL